MVNNCFWYSLVFLRIKPKCRFNLSWPMTKCNDQILCVCVREREHDCKKLPWRSKEERSPIPSLWAWVIPARQCCKVSRISSNCLLLKWKSNLLPSEKALSMCIFYSRGLQTLVQGPYADHAQPLFVPLPTSGPLQASEPFILIHSFI